MDLILVRHGEAEHGGPLQIDAERRLTRAGERAAARTGRILAEHGVTSPRIVTSPKTRALETARILARELEVGPPTVVEALGGGHEPSRILAALDGKQTECVIAVGHMPDLGELVVHLLDPDVRGSVSFRTAGYVWLEIDAIPSRQAARLLRSG